MTLAEICVATAEEVAADVGLSQAPIDDVLTFAIDIDVTFISAFDRQYVRNVVADPGASALCYDTAKRLFDLFRNGAETAAYRFDAVGALEQQRRDVLEPARDLARRVGHALKGREQVVFEITYANHAFIVVVRDGRTEVMQSFMARTSLGMDLLTNTPYDGEMIQRLLLAALVGHPRQSRAAHELLFGAPLELNMPAVRFEYRISTLASDETIRQRLRERMTVNLRFYASVRDA